MNKIINRFSLDRDKFMPGIHLRHPGFPCSAYRPFTKNKERIQKKENSKRPEDSKCIYQNELDKACFQHEMA